jgi:hypothetical protein
MSNLAGAVYVIAATGRSGMPLCQSLLADDVPFIPIVPDSSIASGGALNGIIEGAFRQRYPDIHASASVAAYCGVACSVQSPCWRRRLEGEIDHRPH